MNGPDLVAGAEPRLPSTISCSPTALTIAPGASATTNCTVTSVGGGNGTAIVGCPNPAPFVSCSATFAQVPAGGSAAVPVTVSVFQGANSPRTVP